MNKDKIISDLRNYTQNVEMQRKGAIVRFIKNNQTELEALYSFMTFKEMMNTLKEDLKLEINYKYFLNVYNKLKKLNLNQTEKLNQKVKTEMIKNDYSTLHKIPEVKNNKMTSVNSDMEVYYLTEGEEVKILLQKYNLFDDVSRRKKLFEKKVTVEDLKKHCGFNENEASTDINTALLAINIKRYLNKI